MTNERHEKALEAACHADGFTPNEADRRVVARAIATYLQAMDAVIVPKDDLNRFVSDSQLPREMIDAGFDVLEQCDEDLMNATGPDWDYGMEAVAVYRAMLSKAPNHFTNGE